MIDVARLLGEITPLVFIGLAIWALWPAKWRRRKPEQNDPVREWDQTDKDTFRRLMDSRGHGRE